MRRKATCYNWEYRTLCDFGTIGRRSVIAHHGSLEAAKRAFNRLKKSYSREGFALEKRLWRCWTEDRMNNTVADTGILLYA